MGAFLGNPKVQFFSNDGDFLSEGKVYSFDTDGVTPKATYSTLADATARTNPNSNPVILDARGEAVIVLEGATTLTLTDADGEVIWTVSDVSSVGTNITSPDNGILLGFEEVANAVNNVTITSASPGECPHISVTGDDTNCGLKVASKLAGDCTVDGGGFGDIRIQTISTGDTIFGSPTVHIPGDLVGNDVIFSELDCIATTFIMTVPSFTVTGGLTSGATSVLNFYPSGSIIMYAGSSAPSGYLECDGSAISRTTWATLFAAIGTTYGAGNGTTTFNLPNFQRRVPMGRGGSGTATIAATIGSTGGAETHTLTTAEMPAHTHTMDNPVVMVSSIQGDGFTGGHTFSSTTAGNVSGSTGGGGAHNNVQPCLVVMYAIKVY